MASQGNNFAPINAFCGVMKDTSGVSTYQNFTSVRPKYLPGLGAALPVQATDTIPYRVVLNYNNATTALTVSARQLNMGAQVPQGLVCSGAMVEIVNPSGNANLNFDTATGFLNYLFSSSGVSPNTNPLQIGDFTSFTISNANSTGATMTPQASTGITFTGTLSSALGANTAHLVTVLVTATGTTAVTLRGTQIV